ncbi:DUF5977 domain-containing protein [Chryseobacterium daecheongense]|uniref:DUF5977 domain-containing protein n=1 Tax=Chryseobacterium daecheongense TaxID=192389 RepID=UPI001FD6E316|nr:DUF5977 domain-containing protein [Chryseobacterium daecheongense]UOU99884.1 DUF5977 domain-containing protein [Chryseobacterium daecheongense]
MKRDILWTLALVLLFTKSFSQSEKNKAYYFKDFPLPPSTSAFQRYGGIQNAEYTGANSPMIPLHNVEEGDISIPLNLNYVSGNGIKVRDEASSVGLGWGISMPTITQYVSGGFDDFSQYNKLKFDFLYDSTPPFLRNNFEVCENSTIPPQYLNQLGYDKYTYFKSMKAMLPIAGYFKNYNYGLTEYDTAPDIFVCNLFGERIEFITSNFTTHLYPFNPPFNPTFQSINKKGFKIEYNTTDLFIITNPAGIKYYFSKAEEFGNASQNSNGTTTISNIQGRNYVITKIVDKNSRTINIGYKEILEPGYIAPYAQHLNLTVAYNSFTHSDTQFPPNSYYAGDCKPTSGYGGEYNGEYGGANYSIAPYTSSQTVGEYLVPAGFHMGYYTKNLLLINEIIGDFGTISFEYSARNDWAKNNKLDKILVKNNVSQITKKILFNYSYFDSQASKTVRTEAGPLNIPSTNFPITDVNRFSKRLKLNSILINDTEEYAFKYNSILLPDKDSFAVDYWGYFNGNTGNKTMFPNPTDFDFTQNGGTNVPLNDKNNNAKKANIDFAKAGILEKIIYPTKGYAKFDYELNSADNLFVNEYPSTITVGNGVRLKKQTNYDKNDNVVTQTVFEYEGGKSHNPLDLFKKTTTRLISGVNGSYNSFTTYNFTTLTLLAVSDNTSSPLSSGSMVAYSIVTKKEVDNNNVSKGKIVTSYYNEPETEYQFKDDKVPVYFPKIKSKDTPDNGLVKKSQVFDANNILVKEIENQYTNSLSNLFYGSSLILYHSTAYTNGCVVPSTCMNNGVYQPDLTANAVTAFSFYPIFSKQTLLSSTKTTDFFNNKSLLTKVDFVYDNYNLPQQKYTFTPTSDFISEGYGYSSTINRFNLANILSEQTGVTISKNGTQILNRSFKYDNVNHFNPTSMTTYTLNDPNINTPPDAIFDRYNAKGEILQYTTKEGSPVTVIWGYKQTQPIAKVEGGTYSQVMQAYGLDPNDNSSYLQLDIVKKSDLDTDDPSESTLLNELDIFRKRAEFKDFKITVYTYDPLIGVKTITSPSGFREFYKYDAANRLKRVLDKDENILKENQYNFAPTTYYSSMASQTFIRNNCGSNAMGGSYTYSVPEGQYTSIISQTDADQKALNDISINGQTAANTNGTCTTLNCTVTKGSGISQFNYGSISLQNSTQFRVQMGFRYYSNQTWSTGVIIGKINGNCVPSGERSSSTYVNGVWLLTIDTNGNIIAKISSASPSLVDNMDLNFDFSFSIY